MPALLGTSSPRHTAYRNWDDPRARSALLGGELPGGQALLVLDEIHKFPRWRNLVKGFYDTAGEQTAFLITGSARLDHYRKGGDSLQGRYHHHRLHPFSLRELAGSPSPSDLRALLELGGFPEPLLAGNARIWRRWQRERLSRVVHDDLRDLENVRQVALVANAGPGAAFRELGGISTIEVLPPPGRHGRPPHGTAVSAGHGPARSGFRRD